MCAHGLTGTAGATVDDVEYAIPLVGANLIVRHENSRGLVLVGGTDADSHDVPLAQIGEANVR